MRILSIRFKNLNSLVGEWHIDLGHPAYTADGLFAITGPTGAGKSTLLDALCLALYGRTPRLPRITKSGNEIMARQTGDCFAEAVFATTAGRFRCTWSQRRARLRAEGELQAPRHEIADDDSGRILHEKLRGVAEQVETLTGMDFERFTRSMLLAQGSFAAFLEAAADQRAPILEQITGTALYSRISQTVHERRNVERRTLDALLGELAGAQPLNAEAEAALQTDLAVRAQEEQAQRQLLADTQAAIQWRQTLRDLASARAALVAQQEDWQIRHAAFAPDADRLAAARRALEAAAAHASLRELRNAEADDRAALAALAERLPGREAALAAALDALRQQEGQRSVAQHARHEAEPLLREVRALDLRAEALRTPLAQARKALEATHTHRAELERQQDADLRARSTQQATRDALAGELAARAADAELVEHFAALRTAAAQLTQLDTQRSARAHALAEADTRRNAADVASRTADTDAERLHQALAEQQQTLAAAEAALATQLDQRPLSAWRTDLAAARDALTALDRARADAQQLVDADTALADAAQQLATLTAQASELDRRQELLAQQRTAQQTECELLETQHALLQRIASLENQRHQLEDGKPCPLCGATEHPFATREPSPPDATRTRLDAARAKLKLCDAEHTRLQVEAATLASARQNTLARQAEWQATRTASAARLDEYDAGLLSPCPPAEEGRTLAAARTDLLPTLDARRATLVVELDARAARVAAAESAEQQLATLRSARDRAQTAAAQAHEAALRAHHAADSARQHRDNLAADIAALAAQHADALTALQQRLTPWQESAHDAATLAAALDRLAVRRAAWLDSSARQQTLIGELARLEQRIQHQHTQLDQLAAERAQHASQIDRHAEELRNVQEQRAILFGTQQPDAEEQRLIAAERAADAAVDSARRAHAEAREAHTAALGERDARLRQQAARAPRLAAAETDFATRLAQAGFADETAWQAAALAEETRRALEQRAQALADERLRLGTQINDLDQRINTEIARALSPLPLDELLAQHAATQAHHHALQQQLGALRQQHTANEAIKQQHAAHQQAIAAQTRECTRWDQLHELIGSADGKKYRNFAQGLTFARLIAHANRQLQRLSERYLLTAAPEQPLELLVIDQWQAGERRSTRNLSGGESFIVSLALALGLSHMASQNVRVDSLFLDEGFGTLDEDALDTALDALGSLQQDGKLIGVISHVPALKERIRTQITVTPISGGRSVLSGPGVERG